MSDAHSPDELVSQLRSSFSVFRQSLTVAYSLQHVNGAGAAQFTIAAQTYFCDSCCPLRDLTLPLQTHFFTPAYHSAPVTSLLWPAPLPLRCLKQQTEKKLDRFSFIV